MFYKNQSQNYYNITLTLIIAIFCIIKFLELLNLWYFNFPKINGVIFNIFSISIIALHFITQLYHGQKFKTTAQWINQISLLAITFILGISLVIAVLSTPFTLVDHRIFYLDKSIGLNIVPAVNYVYYHKYWYIVLAVFYNSMHSGVVLSGLILICLDKTRQFHQYLAFMLISFIAGSLIYYFFPTTGLASISNQIPVTNFDRMVVSQFHHYHQHKTLSTILIGHISMPSFHTIAAMLILFTLWEIKQIRYYVLFYSVGLIASALLIGGHFSFDIITGIILSIATRIIAIKLYSKKTITSKSKFQNH